MHAPQGLALAAANSPAHPWRCSRCEARAVGDRPLNCSLCGRSNTFEASPPATAARSAVLSWCSADDAEAERIERVRSGVAGFDRVTGGLVVGRTAMLGGARGLGKSTLALVAASGMAASSGRRVLVAPLEQGKAAARAILDAQGVSTAGIAFTETSEAEELVQLARELRPAAVIVDSWKMLRVRGRPAKSNTSAEQASMVILPAAAAEYGFALLGILHMRTSNVQAYSAGAPVLQLCDGLFRLDRHGVGARLICDAKNRYGSAVETAHFARDGARIIEVQ